MKLKKFVNVLSLVAALLLTAPIQAATLYRYINDNGFQEIGYSIPPHLVPNGYDVVTETGRLVRRVPAQLTEEEYAAKLEADQKLEMCRKALYRVNSLYESLVDIDKAEILWEKKAEEALRNDQANLEYTQTTLRERQDAAARLERQGASIPDRLIESMEKAQAQITTLSAQIANAEMNAMSKAREFDEERRMYQLGECDPDRLAAVHAQPSAQVAAEL